jgi:protein TonB
LRQRPGDALAALRPENVHPADGRATNGVGHGEAPPSATWLPAQWPENVVPFARTRVGEAVRPRSVLVFDAAARPAPLGAGERRARLAAFLVLSLALHAGLYAALREVPKPLASVGVESITIDIVLGGNTEAGVAIAPGETEAQPAEPADEVKPQDQASEQQQAAQEVTEAKPEEPTVAMVETPQPETPTALPRETPPEPPKQVQPLQKPKPKQPAQKKELAPERRQATTGAPSDAANGIGRGRSDSDSNYRGLVAAHLTRNKQYPPDARLNRDQGAASVSFTLDGSGRVTAAHLVRGSGHASLDQEVQAMVRRASPFPAPPGGRAMSFTVPITFRLQ